MISDSTSKSEFETKNENNFAANENGEKSSFDANETERRLEAEIEPNEFSMQESFPVNQLPISGSKDSSLDKKLHFDSLIRNQDEVSHGANIQPIPVDWLGLPLTKSTLPDFLSTTKLHFKYPLTSPEDKSHQRLAPKLRRVADYQGEQSFHDQFPDIGWTPSAPFSDRAVGGYSKQYGQLSELLPHPKTSVWHLSKKRLEDIRKNDPMEYLNLLDPSIVIPTEKAIYQWLIRDQSEIGPGVTIGSSFNSSGFLRNRKPYIPPEEQRDFRSIYKKSFCDPPTRNDIEGLHHLDPEDLNYPGYAGSTTMRDVPSSFMRFGKNVLKKDHRRVMSAKPTF